MSRIAYVNGRYVPHAAACVNIEDRGYQFADGVYEVLFMLDGRFLDEERHMLRLERSLGEVAITPPMGRPALMRVLHEVAARNRLREGLLYMPITRGVARRDHAFPSQPVPPALVVTMRRTPTVPHDPALWTTTAITHPDERWARCDIKSTSLLANVLAKQAARAQGAGEAILVDRDGMVTEGASTTIWIVDEAGHARTRHLDHAILPGCTRGALMTMMAAAGITAEQRGFSLDELRRAPEVFLTSATSFVKPITAIDGVPVGDGTPGPVTGRLFALFRQQAGLPNGRVSDR